DRFAPAGMSIARLTFPRLVRRPAVGQAGQVDFSGGKCRRLPVDHVNGPRRDEDVVGVILAVDDGGRQGGQASSGLLLEAPAKGPEPGKALVLRSSEQGGAPRPAAVIIGIMALETRCLGST